MKMEKQKSDCVGLLALVSEESLDALVDSLSCVIAEIDEKTNLGVRAFEDEGYCKVVNLELMAMSALGTLLSRKNRRDSARQVADCLLDESIQACAIHENV